MVYSDYVLMQFFINRRRTNLFLIILCVKSTVNQWEGIQKIVRGYWNDRVAGSLLVSARASRFSCSTLETETCLTTQVRQYLVGHDSRCVISSSWRLEHGISFANACGLLVNRPLRSDWSDRQIFIIFFLNRPATSDTRGHTMRMGR